MKINKFYFGVAFVAALFATSCDDGNRDYEVKSPVVADNCPSVRFATDNVSEYELDPAAPNFSVKVLRNTKDEATYNLTVVQNDSNAYVVPETVSFAAGDTVAIVPVTMAKGAPIGSYLTLEISVESDDNNPYLEAAGSFAVTSMLIKWETLGRGYLLDGTISYFFGVDPEVPYAIDIEYAETPSMVKYRFEGPWSHVATGDDGTGYFGYVYNEEGDCDEEKHMVVINVTKEGASLLPMELGMDWGYGMFSIGQIYGNLSSAKDKYPLGVVEDGKITFGESSLYVSMADYQDGAKCITDTPTIVYLSKEAYDADFADEEEEGEEE